MVHCIGIKQKHHFMDYSQKFLKRFIWKNGFTRKNELTIVYKESGFVCFKIVLKGKMIILIIECCFVHEF